MKIPAKTESGPSPIRILLVDDDRDDYLLTKQVASEIPGVRVVLDWQTEFDAAVDAIARQDHDVYLIDYQLGPKTGIQLLETLKARNCTGPFILLTGQSEPGIDRAAQAAGAADFLEKSRLDPVVFERMIRYAIRQHAQEADLERKVRERTAELEAVNRALRDSDRRKDEFLATLAHELRNPLAPIRHALELLKLSPDPDTVTQTRAVMERQLTQLVRLVNDLLDASRLNRSKLTLTMDTFDLRDAVSLAVETSRPHLDKAGLTFKLDLPDEPLSFRGDRIRLGQVMTNILNNSAKYTPAGGTVLLTVEQSPSEYRIHVADSGIGIAAEHLDRIFDLFTQVDRTANRTESGLGIGLALGKRIIELHSGHIHVESPGTLGGTTMTICLPIA